MITPAVIPPSGMRMDGSSHNGTSKAPAIPPVALITSSTNQDTHQSLKLGDMGFLTYPIEPYPREACFPNSRRTAQE